MSDCRLSLCMIVRDEAAMLPGFLASVTGLWDELLVADTGSRDGSAELVRAAGGRVVDFAWRDDFAAARNASLATARGRWILFLDADERPDAPLAAAIGELLADDRGVGAATVVMRNALPGGGHREARLLRCFRNVPEVRFRHRVHEDVADDLGPWLARSSLGIRHLAGGVDHLGYVRTTAATRDKKARDQRLLRAALADDPDDLYCRFKLLELARYWDDRELWLTEADAARQALERTPRARLRGRPWSGDLAALIAQALPARPEAALAWLEAQAARVETGAGWHLRHGLLLEESGRAAAAEDAYRRCLACLEAPDAGARTLSPSRPWLGLCRLAVRAGDRDAAVAWALRAVAASPRDPEALLAALSLQPAPAAGGFAARHVEAQPGARLPLARALLTAGRPLAALELLDAGTDDPAAAPGVAVLALTLGIGREVAIELDPEAAGRELRSWLDALWGSGRDDLREAFTSRAGPLAGAFPWLEHWLAERSPGLSSSRR